MIHRVFLIVGVSMLYCVPIVAQEESSPEPDNLTAILETFHSDTNTYKISVINRVMKLTAEEAEKFWPIYREYEAELEKLTDRRLALIRKYLAMWRENAMDEKDWNDLAVKYLQIGQDRLDLWKKYQKKISESLSAMRGMQFLQVEHQMALFIDLNIASEMPVVGESPKQEK